MDVMKLLMDLGADVRYHDPHVPNLNFQGARMKSQKLTRSALKRADLVAIMTAHPNIDFGLVVSAASVVFDARNALNGAVGKNTFKL